MSKATGFPWGRMTLLGLLALLYNLSPIDLVPDFLPFGYLDDLVVDGGYLGYLLTMLLKNRTRRRIGATGEVGSDAAGERERLPGSESRTIASAREPGLAPSPADRWAWVRYLCWPLSLAIVGLFIFQLVVFLGKTPERWGKGFAETVESFLGNKVTEVSYVVFERMSDQKELVCLKVETIVTHKMKSEKWRGDTEVAVWAPVVVTYGIDLSALSKDAIVFDRESNTLTITLPRPRVSLVEVDMKRRDELISTTGTRLGTVSGRYYVDEASRELARRAREAASSGCNLEMAEEAAKRAVSEIVYEIVTQLKVAPPTIRVQFAQPAADSTRKSPSSAKSPERGFEPNQQVQATQCPLV